MAMDASFPPFEDLNEAGQPVGFDVDLAQAIAARWGVQVQIEGIGFDGLVDAVQASRVDTAISALPYQPQLTQDVAFSQPYFEAGLVLVASAGNETVQTVDDLAGRRLAVEWGSEGDVQARALRRRYPDLQILPNETAQDALQAVADGSADAALVDRISALQAAERDEQRDSNRPPSCGFGSLRRGSTEKGPDASAAGQRGPTCARGRWHVGCVDEKVACRRVSTRLLGSNFNPGGLAGRDDDILEIDLAVDRNFDLVRAGRHVG